MSRSEVMGVERSWYWPPSWAGAPREDEDLASGVWSDVEVGVRDDPESDDTFDKWNELIISVISRGVLDFSIIFRRVVLADTGSAARNSWYFSAKWNNTR